MRVALGEVGEKERRALEWVCLGLAKALSDFEGTWPHVVGQAVQEDGGVDADDASGK